MQVIRGDIFAEERIIAHGCNTQGLMGAGFARQVADRFPYVKERYVAACRAGVFVLGYAQRVVDEVGDVIVYNLGTQNQPGRHATPWGVYLSFANMLENAIRNSVTRIAIPRIGAGIGGLDWDSQVVPMIEKARTDTGNHTDIVVYVQ